LSKPLPMMPVIAAPTAGSTARFPHVTLKIPGGAAPRRLPRLAGFFPPGNQPLVIYIAALEVRYMHRRSGLIPFSEFADSHLSPYD
jgi:hypothetical protein